jgi:RimJ/RimL family protein N-acetyltransferase
MQNIETKRAILSRIDEDDLPVLHHWRNSNVFCDFCSTRRNLVDFEEFKDELSRDLSRDRHIQLIVMRKRDLKPVGTIWAYNLNLTDGHTFITVFIDPEYQRIGYGMESFTAMLFYLFDTFPCLNKVYTEAYSYNEHSLSIMKGAGFSEEGIFLEHRLLNGIRYDLHRFAFYRKQFIERRYFLNRVMLCTLPDSR